MNTEQRTRLAYIASSLAYVCQQATDFEAQSPSLLWKLRSFLRELDHPEPSAENEDRDIDPIAECQRLEGMIAEVGALAASRWQSHGRQHDQLDAQLAELAKRMDSHVASPRVADWHTPPKPKPACEHPDDKCAGRSMLSLDVLVSIWACECGAYRLGGFWYIPQLPSETPKPACEHPLDRWLSCHNKVKGVDFTLCMKCGGMLYAGIDKWSLRDDLAGGKSRVRFQEKRPIAVEVLPIPQPAQATDGTEEEVRG